MSVVDPARFVEIQARNLRVAYDSFVALRAPLLDLKGNIISVVGHNGAGKSTFIKSILGLLQPSEGSLTSWNVEGDVRTLLIPEKHMAFCPEIGAVFADISVENYIRLWCRIKHRDANYYKKDGARHIEVLEVAPLLKKLGRELSKGQRRRVQTAIGFLIQPKLFLFDEPFDGLDVQKTSELADIIRHESHRTSFIISSHRMDVVERLSDLLVVLKEGEFLASGSVKDVCSTLCGKSFLLSRVENAELLLEKIPDAFPGTLSNRIGDQVSLTGSALQASAITDWLTREGLQARLEEVQPSLVDAMNFHLKGLGSVSLAPGDSARYMQTPV